MEPVLREAMPLRVGTRPRAVTPRQVAAAEGSLLDGMLSMLTQMQVVLQVVTRFTQAAAAVVHQAAVPGILAPFGVCSQRYMQPKRRYTIMVAVVVRPVVMWCSPAVRPVVAAAGIFPTVTPVHE